jgi:MoxR-like ATPase
MAAAGSYETYNLNGVSALLPQIAHIQRQLEQQHYVTDRAIATTVYLAMQLRKPVLIEGQAGVGKTEIAKVLAAALGTDLIRLQCYEGLDANTALYEWNYPKQMLHIRLEEAAGANGRDLHQAEAEIFSEPYLLKRPLLQAITYEERAPVLLIDEIDRADEEFEAFLLEVLSDFQVTIPELGTVRAKHRPYVALTSNRTRELSDALKRRCLYLWIDYPDFEKEVRIIEAKVEGINHHLAQQIAGFMQVVRRLRLSKTPGMAETLDWAMSLMALHSDHLEPEAVTETLGAILKDRDDVNRLAGQRVETIVDELSQLSEEQLPAAAPRIAQRMEKELVAPSAVGSRQ